jgi:hypothetical protein
LQWSPNITDIFIRESAADDRTAITASGLNELLKLRKLETFVLPGTFIMESDNMSPVASNCVEYVNDNSKLSQLGINFMGAGADMLYQSISSPSLKKIILNMHCFITDKAIEHIVVQCPNLTSIVLDGDGNRIRLQLRERLWNGPTDASIRAIGYHCRQLEELSLIPTVFTSRGIRALMASISTRTRPLTLTLLERERFQSANVFDHYDDYAYERAMGFRGAVEEFRDEQRLFVELAKRGEFIRSSR